MREGLYKIEVTNQNLKLVGVAVLLGGKIYGGGEIIHFSGHYADEGGKISGNARLDIHDPTCSDANLHALRDAKAEFSGEAAGEVVNLTGIIKTFRGTMSVNMKMVALPS